MCACVYIYIKWASRTATGESCSFAYQLPGSGLDA